MQMIIVMIGTAIAAKVALDTIKAIKKAADDLDHHQR